MYRLTLQALDMYGFWTGNIIAMLFLVLVAGGRDHEPLSKAMHTSGTKSKYFQLGDSMLPSPPVTIAFNINL